MPNRHRADGSAPGVRVRSGRWRICQHVFPDHESVDQFIGHIGSLDDMGTKAAFEAKAAFLQDTSRRWVPAEDLGFDPTRLEGRDQIAQVRPGAGGGQPSPPEGGTEPVAEANDVEVLMIGGLGDSAHADDTGEPCGVLSLTDLEGEYLDRPGVFSLICEELLSGLGRVGVRELVGEISPDPVVVGEFSQGLDVV